MSCLEEAADEAVHIIAKLKESKPERDKFCAALDKLEREDKIKSIEPTLKMSPFRIWDMPVHFEEGQYDRILRSDTVVLFNYDSKSNSAKTRGSKGEVYSTTFSQCTCMDFQARGLPCKHMYKLAQQYGGVDFSKIYKSLHSEMPLKAEHFK